MIRDTFFSMPRFVELCRKEMVENWKTNLLRFVLMYGVLAIALVWNAYLEYRYASPGSYVSREKSVVVFGCVTFIWGIVIMGTLSASFIMERMKTKINREAMLMLPATMFEKYISRWLIFTVGAVVAFLIAYKLADWSRVLIYTIAYPENDVIAQVPLSHLVGKTGYWTAFRDNQEFVMGIGGYCFIQSLFVLGGAIWPKNAFIKTFAVGVAITLIYMLIGTLLFHSFLAHRPSVNAVFMSDETMKTLMTFFFLSCALFNWVLAYFRFKESEIINRW